MNDTLDTAAPSFRLLAQSASSAAPHTDRLLVAMLVVCGLMALVLAGLVLFFCIRYRAGSAADRRDPPSNARGLEAAWTVAPLLIFLGIFAWAAHDAMQSRRVPRDALTVHVVGKQWMWKVQHASGRQEINELHLPLGQPVLVVLASQDVIHSFFIPAFRLKQDVVPGRYTQLSFTATEAGDYRLLCTEYCGSQHSAMLGHVVVMQPEAYAAWAADTSQAREADDPVTEGRALYARMACASCHANGLRAPALAGLYGSEVSLEDGTRVRADDQYLRDAILEPRKQVVAGQRPVMPSYLGQLEETQVQALVAYLRSLAAPEAGEPMAAPPAKETRP